MLAELNLALSIIGLATVGALFVVVRRGTRYHGVEQDPARHRAIVHAKVGSFVLLLFAILGVIGAVGGWLAFRLEDVFPGQYDFIQYFAITVRTSIVITLAGWFAWEMEHRIEGRWPKVDKAIDYILTFGHRYHHQGGTHAR